MSTRSTPQRRDARGALSERWPIFLFALGTVVALAPVVISVGTALAWHFRQSTAIQGGIEVIVLWGLLAAAAVAPGIDRWRALLAAVVAALYLRRHHVDAPFLVTLLYVEGVIATGHLLMRADGLTAARSPLRSVAAFFLGTIGFGLVIWTASALGYGRPSQLLVMSVVFLGSSAALARRRPLAIDLAARWLAPARSATERLLGALLLAWLLCLFARTNNVVDYDSLWYALRLSDVLVGERSLFEPLGLVSPVHYFPKLYESLMLPLAVFGDFSFQLGLTIAVLGLIAIMAAEFLLRSGASPAFSLLGAAALITIPAFSNMAVAAKPDLFAAMLLLGAALAAWSVALGQDRRQLGWAFALVLMAVCAKINSAPYGAAILLAGLAVGLLRRSTATRVDRERADAVFPPRAGLVAAVLAIPLALLVTARTWHLTGVPTIGPEQLVSLWRRAGLEIRPPAGTLNWTAAGDWAGAPRLLLEYLFLPDRLPHIVITWVGNFWAVLAVIGAILWVSGKRGGRPPTWVWWPPILAGLWLAFGTRFLVRGGDGNYFLLPLALASLRALAWVDHLTQGARAKSALLAFLAAVALWQAGYAFVSAAWSQPGTRTFDLDFDRSPLDTRATRAGMLRHAGLEEIEAYLRRQPPRPRVVAAWAGDESGIHWLSARAEGLATVSYSRPGYVADGEGFRAFIRAGGIRYLIVPIKDGRPEAAKIPPGARQLLDRLDWDGAAVVRTDRYALVELPDRER